MTDDARQPVIERLHLLQQGEMRARIAAYDWNGTPLGPQAEWPQSLRSSVELMLTSRYPMLVWWGPQLIQFYNDAYVPVLGQRHPWGLGQPASVCWAEAWPFVGRLADAVMKEGASTWSERLEMVMTRNGFPEEVYMTFSYSPILDEAGAIGGLFCACTEETKRVLGDRRLAVLRTLGDIAAGSKSSIEAEAAITAALGHYQRDLTFTLLYRLDDDGRIAQRAGHNGLEPGTASSPDSIDLSANASPWPIDTLLAEQSAPVICDLAQQADQVFPSTWPEPTRTAVLLPLPRSDRAGLGCFLVVGLSPRLVLDDGYETFLHLLARQVAAALGNARAYERERARAEALAELDRAKTTFFSNVSHEFRTPLTLMLGPLEELRDYPDEIAPDVSQRIALAHRNAQRLLKLVNTLLDFARIEAGRWEASYAPVDLDAMTAELASNFRSAVERAGLALNVACEPLRERVFVDLDMWEKIVLNLISNAFKFTHEGAIDVSLKDAADGGVELVVRDTGIGIPSHELPRLFERFHRIADAKGRSFEGSGIGLALVQELVRLHGGRIAVQSEVGKGTAFTVQLPFGASHLPAERAGAAKALPSTAIRAGANIDEALGRLPDDTAGTPYRSPSDASAPVAGRVLLADDNADIVELRQQRS
ncbi:sensor histidine kinase [Candidatus Burkholderia verschuerenii]|uniref:sensor histidine kinase n=1 Tax=Candidatus Burkholderia verschuerenii TaxID=242163 RepID=UPI0018DC34FA|nr:GAF domain-containing sensor histidine kinase [Candidatus Burkholderia verschuerenii]